MTITINVPPEKEKSLKDLAERAGMDVERYVWKMVEEHMPSQELPEAHEEWELRLIAFSQRHPILSHHLSNENLSRENIYEDCA